MNAAKAFSEAAGMPLHIAIARIFVWGAGWAIKVAIAVLVLRAMGVAI